MTQLVPAACCLYDVDNLQKGEVLCLGENSPISLADRPKPDPLLHDLQNRRAGPEHQARQKLIVTGAQLQIGNMINTLSRYRLALVHGTGADLKGKFTRECGLTVIGVHMQKSKMVNPSWMGTRRLVIMAQVVEE